MSAALKLYNGKPRFDFSPDQRHAVDVILEWRDKWPDGPQIITLGGYAGTGKSTLVSFLAEEWYETAVCAFCGKAAHVLRSKGVEATTIHSLIYVPFEDREGKVRYRKRQRLEGVQTIMVDEASMVDHLLYQDLLSFDLPIIFVGDHGQLEPIGTSPNLMHDPQVRLEKIHRQAQDNPIIRLATAFREGREVPDWKDREERVIVGRKSDAEQYMKAGVQIIVGYNKTRHKINKDMRERMGFSGDLPQKGERLICLKNNKTHGLFNGQQFTVTHVGRKGKKWVNLEIETDFGIPLEIPCLKEQFGQNVLEDHKDQQVILADWAYALTAHKSQGSEYSDVLVLEQLASIWNPNRWRYTVATRAKERLVYLR